MSIDSVTTSSVLLVSLAMIALLAAGWRKPARTKPELARVPTDPTPRGLSRDGLSRVSAVPYRPTPWWRRLWSLVAGSGLAVITGAVIATMLGFAAAYVVIELSRLLRQ